MIHRLLSCGAKKCAFPQVTQQQAMRDLISCHQSRAIQLGQLSSSWAQLLEAWATRFDFLLSRSARHSARRSTL
jgi:hypothetical protein